MSRFFIQRPIFAWVIAIFIILIGVLSIPQLPIARFPSVAPPQISITATYPGATPKTLNDSVVTLIEREMSGVKNVLYYSSTADTSGIATITATFKVGTDVDMAQVEVQNKIKAIESRLPQAVRQQGLMVEAASSSFLMMIGLKSTQGQYSELDLSDYMTRNIVEEIKRVEGVGKVQNFGAEKAMRIWVDPERLAGYGLTIQDVSTAIQQQNTPITPGRIGDLPAVQGQQISIPLTAAGQLETVEQFEHIRLRSNISGAIVRLADVAKVELGAQSYSFAILEDGQPSTALAVQMTPGANAVKTVDGIKQRLAELQSSLPEGMQFSIPYDTAPFVKVSIEKVIITLLEAMILVFIVMYVFLHNIRYTLIPAIVAPIALLGTFAVMLGLEFSINALTMFGMVLAIGIIVDDAIVVVENVERIMATEGLSPKDATIKAMQEITSPIIGITLVLAAVFLPMAFASGSVGIIYRQFTVTMSVSILFSAFLALTLTPALCATLLKPIHGHQPKKRIFTWFDQKFDRLAKRYERSLSKVIAFRRMAMVAFLGISAAVVYAFQSVPTAFTPVEDQGWFLSMIQLPSEATQERTLKVVNDFEAQLGQTEGIKDNTAILGFGFSGSGQNAALMFTNLTDFSERKVSAAEVVEQINTAMMDHNDGMVMSFMPPAIEELGTSSGFSLRLLDRGNVGMQVLREAQEKLVMLAQENESIGEIYPDGLPDGSSVRLEIDRDKLSIYGVQFNDVTDIISTSMGSMYINDFSNQDRMQQVIVQLNASSRMSIEDILKIRVNNKNGELIQLSQVLRPVWTHSPQQYNRYNGRPSLSLSGSAGPGVSSGKAMQVMEQLMTQLPEGIGYEWMGLSLEEKQSESQMIFLLLLSMLVIFLILAALYESWSIPVSVMLVVPLGLIGAFAAIMLRGMPNDIFFKVGMITIIGLSAKNAILIVEFAKTLRQEGMSLVDATIAAAKLRLRPILMTSLAFTCGVIPLVFASGASSETQQALGTGVFGGMLSATLLAIIFVPVFFIVVMGAMDGISKSRPSN